jgi:hypothetical protein
VQVSTQIQGPTQAPDLVDPSSIADYGPHGMDYIYHPGMCDYSAPCTDWLWEGYCQNPLRCHPHFMTRGACHGGCGGNGSGRGGCAACGNGKCVACGAAAGGFSCSAAAPSPVQASVLKAPQPMPDDQARALPRATLGAPRGSVR